MMKIGDEAITYKTNCEKLLERLEHYQKAINNIVDHFEHRHNSEIDKGFVMYELDKLTERLKSSN